MERGAAAGASARSFFRRVEVAHVKATLRDLEELTADGAVDEDYIDLGETEGFSPEVQQGECAAP